MSWYGPDQTMWPKNKPNQTLSEQSTCILLKVPVTLGSRLIFRLLRAQQPNIPQRETCRSVKAWKLRCFLRLFCMQIFRGLQKLWFIFSSIFLFHISEEIPQMWKAREICRVTEDATRFLFPHNDNYLLAPSEALIAIPTYYWYSSTNHFFRSQRSSTLDFHFLSHYLYIKAIMLYKGYDWTYLIFVADARTMSV